MQKIFLSTFILFSLTDLFGQSNPSKIYGAASIDNVTFMDKTEVTIKEWIYFIVNNNFNKDFFPNPSSVSNPTRLLFEDLKKQHDFEYIEIIKNNQLVKENFGHKGFKLKRKFKSLENLDTNYFSINNPIVGISFKQAQDFCKWREIVINRSTKTKIKVSLPSFEYYQKVNVNKDSLCKPELKCSDCQVYQINYSHSKCKTENKTNNIAYETQGQGLLRADCYWPSVLGLYNIQGNAAEMTAIEGIAVGGSFRHFAKQSFNDQTQVYTKEEDWLGFRCLITLQ